MNIDHIHPDPHRLHPAGRRAAAGAAARPRQDHAVGGARGHAVHLWADTSPAVPLLLRIQPGAFQFEQNLPWIASPAIHYHVGVDGLSMWLMVLTGLLAPLGVLISWRAIDSRKKLFYILFLLQQVAMMGIFVSLDMFLYYAFWEMSLVPMTLLIATFGRASAAAALPSSTSSTPSSRPRCCWLRCSGSTRRPAPSTCPRLPHLAAQSRDLPQRRRAVGSPRSAFLLAFAVKVPVFPLHGWLGRRRREAPTAAVMVLAGKTALYSILRFSFAIFPDQSRHFAPLMIALAAIGIVYGGLLALVQTDLKRLAAYSTLGQLSFIVLGIFTFTIAGLDGGIYQILNESLAGAALFMLLGLLYERYGTYDMRQYGGLAAKLPWMATHVRHHHALRHRAADAEQLCRRVPHPFRLHAVHLRVTIISGLRLQPPASS